MKAVQYSAYGASDVLRFAEVDDPHPGRGQVWIRVYAAGVNPSDWKRREGQYRAFEEMVFPAGLGVEASGIVDEVGAGVADVAVGDAIFGYGEGTLAKHAVLTHWVAKPAQLSFEFASGLPVVFETAYRCLEDAGVRAGETLLVSGAAGGIGTAIVQVARHRGIVVIGTASIPKHDYLRDLGAIPAVYGPGLREHVRDLAPNGIDAAVDVAGSGILPELIAIVGDPARVVSVADFSAPDHGAKFSFGPPRHVARVLGEVARLCVEGVYRLPIQVLPFEQAVLAQEVSAQGHVTGKLVVRVV